MLLLAGLQRPPRWRARGAPRRRPPATSTAATAPTPASLAARLCVVSVEASVAAAMPGRWPGARVVGALLRRGAGEPPEKVGAGIERNKTFF